MKMKLLATFVLLVLIQGCSRTLVLDMQGESASENIVVNDNRPEEERRSHRESNFSPLNYIGDDKLEPSSMVLFSIAISRHLPKESKVQIDVETFHLIDYFPERIGSGGQGLLGSLIMNSLVEDNTDWNFLEEVGNPVVDSIIVVFSGNINGQPVQAASSMPYELPFFAGPIVKEENFQKAALDALDETAKIVAGKYLAEVQTSMQF